MLPSHEPDKAFECDYLKSPVKSDKKPNTHPLDFLSATCKALRDEVNEWALHFLAQHRAITKYKPYKTSRIQQRRDFLRGRHGLLTWAEKHCVFCGNKSSRSAILMNGLHCCAKCDKEQWPDKITKTEARMKYDLKDEHLLPSATLSPTAVKMLRDHPGLPKVRYGTYITSNVPTTMFLRKDVETLAKLAHGDLKAHLAKRQTDRDERRKRAREAKARRDAEAEAEKSRLMKYLKEEEQKEEHAELLWSYRHKHHSITCYGSEDGPPTSPPMNMSSPEPESSACKKTKKHKKTLSIDSNAANEGRVVAPSPPKQPSPARSPCAAGVMRVQPDYGVWDDVPSMFGMTEAEWDAVAKEQCPPSPPMPTVETKLNELEKMALKNSKRKALDVDVFAQWRDDGVDWVFPPAY